MLGFFLLSFSFFLLYLLPLTLSISTTSPYTPFFTSNPYESSSTNASTFSSSSSSPSNLLHTLLYLLNLLYLLLTLLHLLPSPRPPPLHSSSSYSNSSQVCAHWERSAASWPAWICSTSPSLGRRGWRSPWAGPSTSPSSPSLCR